MMNRRELCSLLPLLALADSWAANDQTLASTVFPFADMKTTSDASHTTRPIVNGKTPTGEHVEVHETTLNPGQMPHAPHKHTHSEFWLMREGTLEVTINGQSNRIGPGSAAFAASNDLHGVKNVGETPAQYFVVAVGNMSQG